MKNSVQAALLLGIALIGVLIGMSVSDLLSEKPDCASVERQQLALQRCLQYRPTCESVTTEDFVVYYDNKDWLDANCPAHSGDGFLSQ